MAKSLNRCTFIGNVGREPETRFTPGNKQVTTFSLACNYKENGDDKTEWIPCVAWEKLAEIAEKYVHKGDRLYVEGRFQTRSWEKDGAKQYRTEIVVTDLLLLGGNGQRESGDTAPSSTPAYSETRITDDDIPF